MILKLISQPNLFNSKDIQKKSVKISAIFRLHSVARNLHSRTPMDPLFYYYNVVLFSATLTIITIPGMYMEKYQPTISCWPEAQS
jgi:hypothetical protein